MSLVNYKYNKECGYYDVIVNKNAIQDIILKKLVLSNEFTMTDIKNAWNKMWHKHSSYIKNHWCPKSIYVQQALDDLIGISLEKTYVSTKLRDGSITEPKYKLL